MDSVVIGTVVGAVVGSGATLLSQFLNLRVSNSQTRVAREDARRAELRQAIRDFLEEAQNVEQQAGYRYRNSKSAPDASAHRLWVFQKQLAVSGSDVLGQTSFAYVWSLDHLLWHDVTAPYKDVWEEMAVTRDPFLKAATTALKSDAVIIPAPRPKSPERSLAKLKAVSFGGVAIAIGLGSLIWFIKTGSGAEPAVGPGSMVVLQFSSAIPVQPFTFGIERSPVPQYRFDSGLFIDSLGAPTYQGHVGIVVSPEFKSDLQNCTSEPGTEHKEQSGTGSAFTVWAFDIKPSVITNPDNPQGLATDFYCALSSGLITSIDGANTYYRTPTLLAQAPGLVALGKNPGLCTAVIGPVISSDLRLVTEDPSPHSPANTLVENGQNGPQWTTCSKSAPFLNIPDGYVVEQDPVSLTFSDDAIQTRDDRYTFVQGLLLGVAGGIAAMALDQTFTLIGLRGSKPSRPPDDVRVTAGPVE
jgi:hypothetical protein